MRRPSLPNREAMILWMGECITRVLSLEKHDMACFNVPVWDFNCKSDTNFVFICRDVDDPEYKPAPALLKDDMEVRPQEPEAHVGLLIDYLMFCPDINTVFSHAG